MTVLTTPGAHGRSARAVRADAPLGSPWPASACDAHGDLYVAGVSLAGLAAQHGTPLYVLDEAGVRVRAAAYRSALPNCTILYAAKAFLCGAMVRWIYESGLGLDVCSGNELALALTLGFPAKRIVLHGNAKSEVELRLAVERGVGRVVVDSFSEIAHLAALASGERPQPVYLRIVPGVEAGHHAAVRTGGEEQQFGFAISDGSAVEAAARILAQPHLRLAGLHCHLGSQISETRPYLEAIDRLVEVLAVLRDRHGSVPAELDLGGGHAIAYRPGDPALSPRTYADAVLPHLADRCAQLGVPVPKLIVEPGRAIVGPAGIALYHVVSVKTSPSGTRFVAVDGGMSDNPRPALYGASYTIRRLGGGDAPLEPARVVGRHCEAGDVMIPDAQLPADTRPGDLLAVPAAGAYHLSMASGYNLVGRPPLIGVRDGTARALQRRETLDDILRRESAWALGH